MSWLKLTKQSLYLMGSNSNCFVKKVDVSSSNSKPSELRLSIPLDWFSGRDVPGSMVIDLESDEPDACLVSVPTPAASTPVSIATTAGQTLVGKRIVLDPGHGEIDGGVNDPGAVNVPLGKNERDQVRKQADIIKAQLEANGATVKIVENNTGKSLGQIGSEGQGADCFVSLHLNAFNRSAQGHEVFAHTAGTSVDVELATKINDALDKALPITNRGVKRAGLGVLSGVPLPVPAVLVESFFIDSVPDIQTLDQWTNDAAKAIAEGVEAFLA
ncbi:N-acetylmuramoyl-L-alanine amidase [Synechococcus sp. PCC 6312]|uniref:N-acetylmuramoyl-L-alanine amidase family protein n=1 Tax=Synechococcus sp. (strain ATCC 27167 / PCC 6312) TaxID=195253 RepID=UPI00029F1BBC|nr:N-acetylmuramoyl-L-alanine amidase [Synechococcus sp. PCC 6312]AFY61797.1 N-acetylmuramoyl-L-alanine amidase [Synechococcus sp. PCC 6312]